MGNSFSDRGRSAHDALSATNECSACGSASTGTPTRHHFIRVRRGVESMSTREGFEGEKATRKSASLPVPINHQTFLHLPITAPQPIPAPGSTREGFGGEKATHKSASLPVPINHQTSLHLPITAPQPIPTPGSTREGFGGEKAARKSASLPVPTNHQTTNRSIIAAQQSLRSASGEVEQKREEIFPQKSGKIASCFCGSFSPHRPTAAESDSDPYAAPAPCRTQGVRGAADTPPASHDHAAPESPRPRDGLKTQLAAWQTVMTIWPKISSATQPRDRSFSGFASPWRIGP